MQKRSESFKDEFPQEMIFINNSEQGYIQMSDNQEIHYYYQENIETKNKEIIFFVQGWGSGIYTWSDLWDELSKEYSLFVLDPRDKESNKLKKESKCTVRRITLDFIEAVKKFNFKYENIIFIGSSMGASYIAHIISTKSINPKACFFISPVIKPQLPNFLIDTALAILPKFMIQFFGKLIGRMYIKKRVSGGFQKKVYMNRVNSINVESWRKCKSIKNWDPRKDYKEISCPTYIVLVENDEYHTHSDIKEIQNLLPNNEIIKVPSYEFSHIKPGVIEFVQILKKYINKR